MNNEGPHPRKLDVIVDSWPYDVTARYWLDENAEIVAVGPQTDDLEAAYKAALLDLRKGADVYSNPGLQHTISIQSNYISEPNMAL
jgi:hypothetical protein